MTITEKWLEINEMNSFGIDTYESPAMNPPGHNKMQHHECPLLKKFFQNNYEKETEDRDEEESIQEGIVPKSIKKRYLKGQIDALEATSVTFKTDLQKCLTSLCRQKSTERLKSNDEKLKKLRVRLEQLK